MIELFFYLELIFEKRKADHNNFRNLDLTQILYKSHPK